ncbi:MAG TPA: LysM peptidoglycan-binding domain-containing protein [Solirubrobacteraceae bacterium]|nr:LysM peptidoglycan-binding domain-containing protein [Solirubrobacteraceae bacterium]
MTLAKAMIVPQSPPGAPPIPVLFNPTRYGLGASNQLAEIGIPGLPAPILQYLRGASRTLTMQLFFDTYEAGSSVTTYTDSVYSLLNIEVTTHAPPICEFRWTSFTFTGVVERVEGQFTLFLADGTPVRATLDVTFREVIDLQTAVLATPTESADHATNHTVVRGETLSGIAAQEYGDPGQWRPIADANHLDNPRLISPGQVLAIPPLS